MHLKVDNYKNARRRSANGPKVLNIKEKIYTAIVAALFIDMMILFATVMQIGDGRYTPHIPFWDAQIRVLLSIVK